ncbi:MAG TPA: AMP-binding protein [Ruminococcaceae bacterium]|jgi:fatty-acyl-CoA synthase|nr:AMP-binding protein [Oscillospiraceae bacterium]
MNQMLEDTVGGLLNRVAEKYPEREAVAYNDRPYRRTWRQFREECDRAAKGLLSIGVGKGDHVAIWATNVPEWLITLFAAAKIGAVLVTVNTNYKRYELEYLLQQSDSKALVMTDGFKGTDYVQILNDLSPTLKASEPGRLSDPNLPYLKSVIHIGPQKVPGAFQFGTLFRLGDAYDDAAYRRLESSLSCQDVINMQYTSGTTGFPKGVMLTHYNIVNNGRAIGDCMNFTEQDRLCIPVPFFHCFGLVLGVMACLTHATSMVPVEYFRPTLVMRAIEQEGCTAVHGVPTMFIAMLDHPEFPTHRFPKLRTGIMAGSPCPEKVMRQVVDRMGMREITITYGETEASPACTMTTVHDSLERRVRTVGKLMPGVEAKIIDPKTGRRLPPNVSGEFCSRGYNTMKGYYKMPEETRRAVDKDGWLHSGDLAAVDEDGYYRITGRIKDMIIRGGENIYPKEIEEFLYTHPAVRDVQVIGVPDEEYGEELMACVILKKGAALTEDEVRDYVGAHLARHKIPKYVRFMKAFPATASGKIQKYKLREQAVKWCSRQSGPRAPKRVKTAKRPALMRN